MNIGDLVKDKITEKIGIIVEFHWQDDEDELHAVVCLSDNSMVLCSYEDMDIITNNLQGQR